MSKNAKIALRLGAIGFVVGIMIGLTVYYFSDVRLTGVWKLSGRAVFELLIGGIYGALSMGSSAVYEIESWSIAKATATHFIISFGGFFLMAYLQGWMKPGDLVFNIVVIVFIIVYIMIWLFQYLAYKRKVKRMNDALEEMKKG